MSNDVDVIVVGGGVSGLSAACSAAEAGATVVLLERAPEAETGGNTRYTEAFLRMKSLERTADDFEEILVDDFMGYPDPRLMQDSMAGAEHQSGLYRAAHTVDPNYVATLSQNAPKTLAWMARHGVRFDFIPTPFLTQSTTRMAPVGGGLAIIEALGKAARDLGVEFRFETTAQELLRSACEVVGVQALTRHGAVEYHGQVVLASGGYEGNAEMMARYHPGLAMTCRPVARGGYYNKGEGIEMAVRIGAATAGNFNLFHAEPIDPRSGEPEAAIFCFPYGVLVNKEGKRFVDEARGAVDAWYERTARSIQAQTDGIAWVILDQQSMAVPNIKAGIRTTLAPVQARSVGELADRLQLPREGLEKSIRSYNDACPDSVGYDYSAPDGLATIGLQPQKSNWAKRIDEPPYVAYPIICSIVFTFGGLKTSPAAEVVDRDGRPIRGLYAAGEMTGLYYSNYAGSTSVLRGATFGRIAGEAAARAAAGTIGA